MKKKKKKHRFSTLHSNSLVDEHNLATAPIKVISMQKVVKVPNFVNSINCLQEEWCNFRECAALTGTKKLWCCQPLPLLCIVNHWCPVLLSYVMAV